MIRYIRPVLVPVFLCLSVANPYAQIFERQVDSIPVVVQGDTLKYPFFGGFTSPKARLFDIDSDADLDLFILDASGYLSYFKNAGTPVESDYRLVTNHYQDLIVGSWFDFGDLDLDGDLDLLVQSSFDLVAYYRNSGDASNADFELVADTLRECDGFDILSEPNSFPVLADINSDGYLDFFSGLSSGSVTYYENNGVTPGGLPDFCFVTSEWEGLRVIGPKKPEKHGASALVFADMDADLDLDLIWGDMFNPGLYYIPNVGTPQAPDMMPAPIDSTWMPGNLFLTAGMNMVVAGDGDNDGDIDLYVGVLGVFYGSLYGDNTINNFRYFRNDGSAASPFFTLVTENALQGIDLTARSAPAFADLDADGDVDMLVGNWRVQSDGNGTLNYFENTGTTGTGTAGSPVFELVDDDYGSVNSGWDYAPAFSDVDGDGDIDIVVGNFEGKLKLLENVGSPTSPQFQSVSGWWLEIDVGNNSAPVFVDLDFDGDDDLIIGEKRGNLNYYENIGGSANPSYQLESDFYGGIDVGDYAKPAFGDLDGDGDIDLIIGEWKGRIHYYRNDGTQQSPSFVAVTDQYLSIDDGAFEAPALVDVDGDFDVDIITGCEGGGLILYRNLADTTSVSDEYEGSIPRSPVLLSNYPNPFNSSTTISLSLSLNSELSVTLYDIHGRTVASLFTGTLEKGSHLLDWNGRDSVGRQVASGVYILNASGQEFSFSRKMLLLK